MKHQLIKLPIVKEGKQYIVDIRSQSLNDTVRAKNMITWCKKNLSDIEWEMIHMSVRPFWYRFRFSCHRNKMMGILSS